MTRNLLATLLSLLCVTTALAAKPEPLRILSYNIHHGEGVDGKLDLPRIADVIKSAAPHLVLLQEVDRNTARTGNVDQAAELGKLTGMEVAFGGNLRLGKGDYGNAILSRFPLREVKNYSLPNLTNGETRGVLSATVQVPSTTEDETILILATHLDHRTGEADRLASIDFLRQLVGEREQVTIIGGDFNATLESAVLKKFQEHWALANVMEKPTFPVAKPERQIDFVGYRPMGRFQVGAVRVLEEAVASDHRPILVELLPSMR
ncbi:endonuclease/exonuclease/phosphatase family protein [Blastopirellula sp. J2-11]|uniref:endonuclease/exonuclease/phosphatase family protein n=1 Tax=Blastopirellula sp. J2-11 TaxID=2943192 RepID=UPI0021C7E1AD|nr:endonuclease/exonuclease/phosphatase family protein [Blastopirellula sp. J2-11]UUO07453.1 endonuclease/exonuclease/phosphatase family protein [Blastopirellula sp. J2-11]